MKAEGWIALAVFLWVMSQADKAKAALSTAERYIENQPEVRRLSEMKRRDKGRAQGVLELAKKTGFPDPVLATAIAYAESRCNPEAIGDGGTSIGLWQIHLPAHPGYSREYLLRPSGNARAAFRISKGGTDWSPWSTYKTGAYKRFLRHPEKHA